MFVFYVILITIVAVSAFVLFKFFAGNITIFIAAATVALLIPLPVYAVTTAISKNDQQTFHEYWNGYETAATSTVLTCERDGSCRNTFKCDPYTTVEIEYYTDSDGKQQSRMVTKTHYHDCPYSVEETSYYVDSTVETFAIASSLMTGAQYRFGHAIPGGQISSPPQSWLDAKTRIDSAKPGPVTVVKNYKNFILSSERSLFKRYSDQIDSLVAEGNLPTPISGVVDTYSATKAYFVGTQPKDVDVAALTKDVAYLNGAVGNDLHGDLHVVFVDSGIADATDYSNSLMAYWQDSKTHGKNAISKNAIIVVVGIDKYSVPAEVIIPSAEPTQPATVDGVPVPVDVIPDATVAPEKPTIKDGTSVVKWAKAFTGMPLGNEALLTQIESNLKGAVVDSNLIGQPTYDVAKSSVIHTEGKLETILFGANKFERVSMSANDENDSGSGFSYLAEEWVPDSGTMAIIFWTSSVLILLVLAFGAQMSYTRNTRADSDFVKTLITNLNEKERKK
jgi:hypothetical protein